MAFLLPAAATAASTSAATSAGIAASTAAAIGGGIETASIPIAATAAATSGWLGAASLGLTALSGGIGAIGAIQQGKAAKSAADYNAAVAQANADQAKSNSQIASEAGMAREGMSEQKTRAAVGQLEANQAASGVDINKGSALDVRSSADELGQLDAITVRGNATKEAYGYQIQSINDKDQAELDRSEGRADESAGYLNAGSTLLGAAGQGFSNYKAYKLQGGFSA